MENNWNAEDYGRKFSYVHRYGEDILNLLSLPEGACVVDVGCGNGVLTQKLSGNGYKVLGIDSSEAMLQEAGEHYPDIQFIKADAEDFLLDEKVDGIFSNAVFHWISEANQDLLLTNLNRNLKMGGQLVFEFGGKGNVKTVLDLVEALFNERNLYFRCDFYFPSIGEYAALAEQCGFKVTDASLFERPTRMEGEHALGDWISMFLSSAFTGIKDDVKREIISQAEEILKDKLYHNGAWELDYVRLRMKAVKVEEKKYRRGDESLKLFETDEDISRLHSMLQNILNPESEEDRKYTDALKGEFLHRKGKLLDFSNPNSKK